MSASAGISQARSGTRLFPGRTEIITNVRSYLAERLDGFPLADDAILCGSELAANAAVHSRSGRPDGHFAVRVQVSPGQYAQIEVSDLGGAWTPAGRDGDLPHGLDIVAAIASDSGEWGIERGNSAGTRVAWVRLQWPDKEGQSPIRKNPS